MMRSRSRWYSVRPRGGASRWRRPRERSTRAAYRARSRPGMRLARAQHLHERCARHLARYESLADTLEQHEAYAPAFHLLVVPHQLEKTLRLQRRRLERQAARPQHRGEPLHVLRGEQAEALRKPGCQQHAGAHRLTVQPGAVARAGFDRVAEGMPEIEQCARTALPLVERDDFGLVGAGALDGVGEGLGLAPREARHVGLEPVE